MHPSRLTNRLLAVGALLSGALGAPPAQAQPGSRPTPRPSALAELPPAASVGSPLLDPRWIVPASDTMVMTREAAASPVADWRSGAGVRTISDLAGRIAVGSTIQTVRRLPYGGRDAFQVDFEQRDSTSVVDQTTTWVDARTLQPLAQHSLLGRGRTATLTFGNDTVVIVDAAPGRSPRTFAAPLPESAYTAAALDLVLRALPLRGGYRTVVPLYFPAEQYVFPLAVRVEGTERLNTRSGRLAECWVVAGDFPGGITERFWIEKTSHTLLRILAHASETALVRYDR